MKHYLFTLFLSLFLSMNISAHNYTKADYEKECIFDDYDFFVVEVKTVDRHYIKGRDPLILTDGLIWAMYLGKWGCFNNLGEEIFSNNFSVVNEFHEGLAKVCLGGKWGFVNKKGEFVIKPKYSGVQDFSEGLAAVYKDKWGFVNKKGEFVIEPEYNDVGEFSEGLAAVKKDDKWGFINKKGELIIKCAYKYVSVFSDGMAFASDDKDSHGFIDKQGKVVIPLNSYKFPFRHRDFHFFKNGHSIVILNGETSHKLIDKKGKIKDNNVSRVGFQDGMYVFYENKKYGVKNINGSTIIPPTYDYIRYYNDGYFTVEKNGLLGVIDIHGKIVVPIKYGYVGEVHEGIVEVAKENKSRASNMYAFVDVQGKEITPFVFNDVLAFSGGIAAVKINNKVGFVGKDGAPIKIDFRGETLYRKGCSYELDWEFKEDSKEKNYNEALYWYKQSANKGYNDACGKIGYFYYMGIGVETNYAEAVKWFEKIIQSGSNINVNIYLYLGICYYEGGYGIIKNEAKAKKYFTLGASFNNPDCFNALAYIEAHNKIYSNAIVYINKAINLNPSDPNLYDSKGEIYLMMGKDDEAIKMWKKVLELNPKFLDEYPSGTNLYNQLRVKGKI